MRTFFFAYRKYLSIYFLFINLFLQLDQNPNLNFNANYNVLIYLIECLFRIAQILKGYPGYSKM